jgi:SAM-dependent methyltransferase
MDEYIEANKQAWGLIAPDHYQAFYAYLSQHESTLNQTQLAELGDIAGKRVIHLQCNTGADSISLARLGAQVTGVDLVPENVYYARKLAADLGQSGIRFIESNVLTLMDSHHEKYDLVYTTEGVLCWLPDLSLWARTVRHLLAGNGFLYLLDSHPFFMVWDEDKLPELIVKYPYFLKNADESDWIGGYASEAKPGANYSWMYTLGEIITALSQAGLHVAWLHEFDWLFYQLSSPEHQQVAKGQWFFPQYRHQLPFTFSLKAVIR